MNKGDFFFKCKIHFFFKRKILIFFSKVKYIYFKIIFNFAIVFNQNNSNLAGIFSVKAIQNGDESNGELHT